MSREILFRGKRVDNGEWVEGYLMDENYINVPFNDNDVNGRFDDPVEVEPETVCEYTGLNDENDRKIFEGDIVKTSQYGVDDGNCHNYAGFDTFSVEFSDGGFCLKNKWRRFNLRPQRGFEVIGNIFDDKLQNQRKIIEVLP